MARMLDIDVDDRNAWKLYGFLKSLSVDFGRTKNISPILQKVFADVKVRFDQNIDAVARANTTQFHHVYEWNLAGVPQARLFDAVMVGSGKERMITFRWRASKTPVPVPSLPPSKSGLQLMEGVHVFVWKAPIMEYNIPVLIAPVLSENLAFPATGPGAGGGRNGLVFTQKAVRIRQPGGSATTGSFNAFFLAFWSGEAGEHHFKQILEDIAGDHDEKMLRALHLSKVGARKITKAQRDAAFSLGEAQARKFFSYRNADYINQARRRREFILHNAAGGSRFD